MITPSQRQHAADLLAMLEASPSPWHAVATMVNRLQAAGFLQLHEQEAWHIEPCGRYFVVRGDSSLLAFIVGDQVLAEAGFRIIGAHTDSPGLRIKPKPCQHETGLLRLGVEVYGGPILATFADRDLSLAGRVFYRTTNGIEKSLVRVDAPLLRLPNLAIHMNREVNEQGLKFNRQTELPLLLAQLKPDEVPDTVLMGLLAEAAGVDPGALLSWDLNVFDTQPGAFWGAQQAFIADGQLDNLASCHAGLTALLTCEQPASTAVCAFFDHEEVGSESAVGAGSSFIGDVLSRICNHAGLDQEARFRAFANSFFVSADMAHAYHPAFPQAYEPSHHVLVNHGPVIKTNASQRYTTNAETAARFMTWCASAQVPYQSYVHRSDLGCGSTIGPIVASRLGMPSIDVGCPMWAMHSVRESAGVADHAYMTSVMRVMLEE